MGGLFSSEPKQPPPKTSNHLPRHYTNTYQSDHQYPTHIGSRGVSQSYSSGNTYTRRITTPTRHYENFDELSWHLAALNIRNEQPIRRIQGPEKSKKNLQLFDFIDTVGYTSQIVTYIRLEPYDPEYLLVVRKITNKKNFKVDSIEKISNPYLETAYELKKAQKRKDFPNIEERLLFHGTKRNKINAICEKNFNWRLCQTHKYGNGVSFSPNSTYASVYSDENVYNKVMLVVKVLVGRSCIGNKDMILPPYGCDTSQKGVDGIVIVKYEDNEYYPVYKINYHQRIEQQRKRGGGYNNTRSPLHQNQNYFNVESLYFD